MLNKFKSLDKKFLLLVGGIIAVPIVFLLLLLILKGCTSKPTFPKYEEKMIKSAQKYFERKKKIPTSEGETTSVTLKQLIELKYIKSPEKSLKDSTCTGSVMVQNNGASLKENKGGNYLYTAKLKCKKYETKALKDSIISKKIDSGAGLYEINGEYIYKGDTDASKNEYVDNYVKFFDRDYRIIKLDSNGDLKLIKVNQERNSLIWDTKYNEKEKKSYGENLYSDSSIIRQLFNNYLNEKMINPNSKKYIVAKTICLASRSETDGEIYKDSDCTSTLENQLIGLISISDFASASLDTDCNSLYSRSCKNYNYMNGFLGSTWTYNSISDNSYEVFVFNDGIPYTKRANSMNRYNMVIYISGNITNYTGTGNINDPYIIK